MLHAISWMHFIKWILLLTLFYYSVVILLFFPKETVTLLRKRKKTVLLLIGLTGCSLLQAQDGNQGISQANTMVRGYYDTATQLLYGIGGVMALVGAIRVYKTLNEDDGHGHSYKAAAGWIAGCIFLVVVSTVIRAFFGL